MDVSQHLHNAKTANCGTCQNAGRKPKNLKFCIRASNSFGIEWPRAKLGNDPMAANKYCHGVRSWTSEDGGTCGISYVVDSDCLMPHALSFSLPSRLVQGNVRIVFEDSVPLFIALLV
jgi:hypothetical protein